MLREVPGEWGSLRRTTKRGTSHVQPVRGVTSQRRTELGPGRLAPIRPAAARPAAGPEPEWRLRAAHPAAGLRPAGWLRRSARLRPAAGLLPAGLRPAGL